MKTVSVMVWKLKDHVNAHNEDMLFVQRRSLGKTGALTSPGQRMRRLVGDCGRPVMTRGTPPRPWGQAARWERSLRIWFWLRLMLFICYTRLGTSSKIWAFYYNSAVFVLGGRILNSRHFWVIIWSWSFSDSCSNMSFFTDLWSQFFFLYVCCYSE